MISTAAVYFEIYFQSDVVVRIFVPREPELALLMVCSRFGDKMRITILAIIEVYFIFALLSITYIHSNVMNAEVGRRG
jgi:hypothetical protein